MEISQSKTKFEKVIGKLSLKKSKNKSETIQTFKAKNNDNRKIKKEIKKLIGESLIETYLKLINTIDKKNFNSSSDSKEGNAIEKLRESIESSLTSKNNSIHSHSLELVLFDEKNNENSDSKNSSSLVIKKPNIFEGINHLHLNKRKNLNSNQININENENDNFMTKENKKTFRKLKERDGDTSDCEYKFFIFSDDNSLYINDSNKLSDTNNNLTSNHFHKKKGMHHMLCSNPKNKNYSDNNYYNMNMKELEKNKAINKLSQPASKSNIKKNEASPNIKHTNKSYICFNSISDSLNHNMSNCKKNHEIFKKASYSKNKEKYKNQNIKNANKRNLCQNTEVKKKTNSVFQLSKGSDKKSNSNIETNNNTVWNKNDCKKLDFDKKKLEKNTSKSNNINYDNNNNSDNNDNDIENNNNTNIINYSFGNKIIKVYYVNSNSSCSDKINDYMKKYRLIKKEKQNIKINNCKNRNKNNINNKKVIISKNNNNKNENHEEKKTKKLVINKSAQTFQKKNKLTSKLSNNYSYLNKANENPFNATTVSFRNIIKNKIKQDKDVSNIIKKHSKISKRKIINNSKIYSTEDK